MRSAFGGSTFGKIERTLTGYEKAGDDVEKRAGLLQQLDVLCTDWWNKNAQSSQPYDLARRPLVQSLLDTIAVERAALARHQAQQIYLTSVKADPGTQGAFKALTSQPAPMQPKKVAAAGEAEGLTKAEVHAILQYTNEDYKYINPVVANSAGWLIGQKDKYTTATKGMVEGVPEDFVKHVKKRADEAEKQGKKGEGNVPATAITGSARPVVEEAGLHAGVAMQGLRKLPAFTGETYRGEHITPAQFKEKYFVGQVFPFNAFGSSSKSKDVAADFGHGLQGEARTPEQTVVVFQIITNSGGRDISELSVVPHEKEVLILPGSKFKVNKMRRGRAEDFPDQVARLKADLPKEWWIVELSPVPKAKSPRNIDND
jgi:hypothetical protein